MYSNEDDNVKNRKINIKLKGGLFIHDGCVIAFRASLIKKWTKQSNREAKWGYTGWLDFLSTLNDAFEYFPDHRVAL